MGANQFLGGVFFDTNDFLTTASFSLSSPVWIFYKGDSPHVVRTLYLKAFSPGHWFPQYCRKFQKISITSQKRELRVGVESTVS